MRGGIMHLGARLFGILVAIAVVAASVGISAPKAYAATAPQVPSHDPFYSYSGSLASIPPGTVLKARTVTVPWEGLKASIQATQLLYRTTDELGNPTVTVTTVLQPLKPVARYHLRIVSWQMFYDALGSQCDPSYTLRGGNPGYGDSNEEEWLMTPYLAAGDTLVVSDYEGENLAWGAGQQSGYETLDGIRAAESWLKAAPSTTPVAMIGYSGGSIATQWAAEMAPAYAPELDIVGAAAGGVPVDYAHNLAYINGSPDWSGVIPAILVGMSRAFHVDLDKYLSAYGRKVAEQVSGGCINSFVGNYPGLTIQKLLKPRYQNFLSVPIFASIVNEVIMGSDGTPRIPMFMANGNADGTGDDVMVAADVEALSHLYCERGLSVQFDEYKGLDHEEAAVPFELEAFPLLTGWLNGLKAPSGCKLIGTGNSLAPLKAGTAPPPSPSGAATYATVTSVDPQGTGAVVDDGISVTAQGAGALTLSGFNKWRDPVRTLPGLATGRYFDIRVAPGSRFSSMTVEDCSLGHGDSVDWWDPSADSGVGAWEPVAPAANYVSGRSPCTSFYLSGSSSPKISQLTGTVFAITSTPRLHITAGVLLPARHLPGL